MTTTDNAHIRDVVGEMTPNYAWDVKDQHIIDTYIAHHLKMVQFFQQLRNNGPVGLVMPQKPKADIKPLLGVVKQPRPALGGDELHHYLERHTVENISEVTCPKTSSPPVDVHELLDNANKSFQFLKAQNSNTLSASIDCGEWLNAAYYNYNMNVKGNTGETWKEWLEINVGIHDSYARKLRTIAKILSNYPRFRKLGLSFLEVYQRRKEIQCLLQSDLHEYWK